MEGKFKPTKERSQHLFHWLMDEIKEQKNLEGLRLKIINSNLSEQEEKQMLQINSENYELSKEMQKFCTFYIVPHHLSTEDQKTFFKTYKTYKDDSLYQI